MKKIAILMLFTTLPNLQAEDVHRTFQLKYTDPRSLIPLITTGHITFDSSLKALTITARDSAGMSEAEEIIKRFDVPPPAVKNIDVTIYLMSALAQPAGGPIPAELESVVKQLKSTFSYKGYQLIDTEVIRVRAGQGGEVGGVVIDGPALEGYRTISQVKFKSASVSTDEKGRTVRIDSLKVGLKIPTVFITAGQRQFQYIDTGMSTDVDVREGQKVVVGKANMDGSDRASIVVLMAKVVE
jgi:hypothetical protein